MEVKPINGEKTRPQDLKSRKYQHLESVRVCTHTRPLIAKLVAQLKGSWHGLSCSSSKNNRRSSALQSNSSYLSSAKKRSARDSASMKQWNTNAKQRSAQRNAITYLVLLQHFLQSTQKPPQSSGVDRKLSTLLQTVWVFHHNLEKFKNKTVDEHSFAPLTEPFVLQ